MAKPKIKLDLQYYPSWLHEELLNWSRWCWLGKYPHPMPETTCASFEKNYQRISEEGTVEDVRPIPPNTTHALIVQQVWETLPHMPKQVLRAEYPQRRESGRIEHGRKGAARFLHISLNEYESALSIATYRILIAFEGKE